MCCVTLRRVINHSVYFFQHLEIGDDGSADFPKVGERIPGFCMLLPLAGCLAHIKCGSSDGVDDGACDGHDGAHGGDDGALGGGDGACGGGDGTYAQVFSSHCLEHSSLVSTGCSVK